MHRNDLLKQFLPDETKQLTLINIDDADFERTKQLTFDLYVRYQTQVHNDPPVDMCEFNNYICKSPIKVRNYLMLFQMNRIEKKLVSVIN